MLDIGLASLSEFLSSLRIAESGRALLLDAGGRIIAGEGSPITDSAGRQSLPTVLQSPLPEVAALGEQPALAGALEGGLDAPLRYEVEGQTWIGTLVSVGADARWVVAVMAPEDEFLGELRRATRRSAGTTAIFLALGLVASAVMARWIARSMSLLVGETARVRDLHLDESPLRSTPFREVYEVLEAFEGMKTGLRAFQKYMPVRLVRKLLMDQAEPRLESQPQEITLYFSDIAGFTPIAERLSPPDIARRLGAYHSALTACIQGLEGTVVQYVGDEIMAFWGAPAAVDDAAAKACEAALRVQALIPGLFADEPDIPVFHTRIGVHTAEVSVGHFGSAERLYYGAVGDGVNLTSRLEGLNKYYGTAILVSGATWERLGERFAGRRLDRVAVAGKREVVEIVELLGRAGEVDAATMEAARHYERGLTLYRARRFEEARARFHTAAALRPGDRAAALLLQRCEQAIEHPPGEDWDGAWSLDRK